MAAVTALAFLPILQNGFVDFDDAEGLVVNTWIRGLGAANLRWMLTTFHLGHWQPLAWLSFALDYRLWGLDARGFHLTSLLLHAANAALLAVLAERLLACADVPAGRRLAGAVTAALLWSVHPLRVESVAWATERRDVLSGFFFLATLLAYVPGPGRPPRIGWALAGTALTLASKASGMVLPALLVLLDLYPLRRVGGAVGWRGRAARRVWLEKVPFVILAGASATVALTAQRSVGALQTLGEVTAAHRAGAAMLQVGFYLWRTLWPVRLLPLYEFPLDIGPLQRWALAGAGTVLALAAAAVVLRHRCPALGAALAAYLIALSPTLGLAQSGPQVAADRYTYLAMMGWPCSPAQWSQARRSAPGAARWRRSLSRSCSACSPGGSLRPGATPARCGHAWSPSPPTTPTATRASATWLGTPATSAPPSPSTGAPSRSVPLPRRT